MSGAMVELLRYQSASRFRLQPARLLASANAAPVPDWNAIMLCRLDVLWRFAGEVKQS